MSSSDEPKPTINSFRAYYMITAKENVEPRHAGSSYEALRRPHTVKLYTIGFTKKSAEKFFDILKQNEIQLVLDIRLHPNSQLAGFAKQNDLAYFLPRLADCGYIYMSVLTPAEEILSDYRRDHDWTKYARRFESLMSERNVPACLDRSLFEQKTCCLLCSEASPDRCHRRLVAERLAGKWQNLEVVHLT
jgi:uncharacterized protein (DUF488 family)